MNLFAVELARALARQGQHLSALYTLRDAANTPLIPPAKIARLQRSLSEDISAVLSERELLSVADAFSLDANEVHRLRAAIVGERVHRLLVGRVTRMSALEEGERVTELLLNERAREDALKAEFRQTPGASQVQPTADTNAAIAGALEPAAEACQKGELWLALAASQPMLDEREDLLGAAWTAFNRATELLAFAPAVAQGSAAQAEWRSSVDQALATLREIQPLSPRERTH